MLRENALNIMCYHHQNMSIIQEKFQDSSLSDKDKEAFQKKVTERSMTETSAFYAASRVWNDGLVLPQDTRKVIRDSCLF